MPAASSIYWDSVDSQRSSGGSSGDGNSAISRHYVDPWDLENYAYLRRHSIATPQQYKRPVHQQAQQQQRIGHRRRSHERRTEPEVEYWYSPRDPTREPGYHAPASVEELYFSGSSRERSSTQASYYQPIYEDHYPRYATPVPIYAPLSELEHSRIVEDQRLQGMLGRRNKLERAKGHERNRTGDCLYHGSSSNNVRRDASEEPSRPRVTKPAEDACYVELAPPSTNLGLNTYGHLKIDYTDSWNSLHRKITK